MIQFIIYKESNGLVVRRGNCSNQTHLAIQAGEGELCDTCAPENVLADGRWHRQPDGTYIQLELPVSLMKEVKLAELDLIAKERLSIYADGNLQVDDVSMGRLMAWVPQAIAAQANQSAFALSSWIMADNSIRQITGPDDFLALFNEATVYRTSAIQHNAALKQAIRDATSAEALSAIDLSAGWPEKPSK